MKHAYGPALPSECWGKPVRGPGWVSEGIVSRGQVDSMRCTPCVCGYAQTGKTMTKGKDRGCHNYLGSFRERHQERAYLGQSLRMQRQIVLYSSVGELWSFCSQEIPPSHSLSGHGT